MVTPHTLGTALVTGASSGIGALYAQRLAQRGYDLILVARTAGRLDALAQRLRAGTGRTVEVIAADLGQRQQLARVEAVLRSHGGISLLVNNAGFGAAAPLLDADVDNMTDLIELNVTALTRLTYAAVPGMVARGGGAVINIASVVAVGPEILNGVYGGSKAFVLAFSQSLRHELADKGIRVQAVLPGATATAFWDRVGTPVAHLPGEIVMRAEDMVDAALVGYDLGELVTIPSLPEAADWDAYEAARQQMMPNLSRQLPAARYRTATPARG
jgi:uncharacterized protein